MSLELNQTIMTYFHVKATANTYADQLSAEYTDKNSFGQRRKICLLHTSSKGRTKENLKELSVLSEDDEAEEHMTKVSV